MYMYFMVNYSRCWYHPEGKSSRLTWKEIAEISAGEANKAGPTTIIWIDTIPGKDEVALS